MFPYLYFILNFVIIHFSITKNSADDWVAIFIRVESRNLNSNFSVAKSEDDEHDNDENRNEPDFHNSSSRLSRRILFHHDILRTIRKRDSPVLFNKIQRYTSRQSIPDVCPKPRSC